MLREQPHGVDENAKQARSEFCELVARRELSDGLKWEVAAEHIIFDFSIGEVRDRAEQGCLLCRHFKDSIEATEDWMLLACVKVEPYLTFGVIDGRWKSYGKMDDAFRFNHTFTPFEDVNGEVVSFDVIAEASECFRSEGHAVSSSADRCLCALANPSAREITSQPIQLHPSSDHTVELARGWLQKCSEDHPECTRVSRSEHTFLPTRLLEIWDLESNMEFIRLRNTQGMALQPYVALSYCWGSFGQTTTVRQNLDSHLAGISVANLQPTIRDAIDLTRKLGFKHLWIDSLCIVQDDASYS